MRKEQVELDWRMVLCDKARALVQAVIPPDQRPTSKDLEAGIQRMQRSLSLAQGQAEGARSVASDLASRLEKALSDLRADQHLVFLVRGVTVSTDMMNPPDPTNSWRLDLRLEDTFVHNICAQMGRPVEPVATVLARFIAPKLASFFEERVPSQQVSHQNPESTLPD